MKLWIIYMDGFIISKMIAEFLQDQLEYYLDVSVGNAKKVHPSLIVEDKVDCLIFGEVTTDSIPSFKIQEWVVRFGELSRLSNYTIKSLSAFVVGSNELRSDAIWNKFFNENINFQSLIPPILYLHLDRAEILEMNLALQSVKTYSKCFIEYLTNLN